MKLHFEDTVTNGQFVMSIGDTSLRGRSISGSSLDTTNTIVFNNSEDQKVTIDNICYTMPARSVLPLVANQHFIFEQPDTLTVWQFNREFYCIADHDAEVGCAGFLFYGLMHPFFITVPEEEVESLNVISKLCVEDMTVKDKMQGEMLRTLLKRLIINITRLAKKQTENYVLCRDDKMEIIRKFNMLLEAHFRSQHEVQFYAKAMNKSPKTLSNIFGICNYPSPSSLIRNRITLEAKRYRYFTNKSAKEVADELGFASAAHFSRFFKLNTGVNFSEFNEVSVPGVAV